MDARLFVANGGNNAVAVIALAAGPGESSRVDGFIPTAWYPGARDKRRRPPLHRQHERARLAQPAAGEERLEQPLPPGHGRQGGNSRRESELAALYPPGQGRRARAPDAARLGEIRAAKRQPAPVPKRLGDPSVFEHVVYIIKENRTYDQVFGDLPQGNGDPSLCIFGREVTPNHHALAEEFVLLDNYYCNGVCSADGHAWAMEGYATDYLEKSFGGWARSYPFSGDDPLSFAPTGFIWDHVLLHGLSFRNYGEMSQIGATPRQGDFPPNLPGLPGQDRQDHLRAQDRDRDPAPL